MPPLRRNPRRACTKVVAAADSSSSDEDPASNRSPLPVQPESVKPPTGKRPRTHHQRNGSMKKAKTEGTTERDPNLASASRKVKHFADSDVSFDAKDPPTDEDAESDFQPDQALKPNLGRKPNRKPARKASSKKATSEEKQIGGNVMPDSPDAPDGDFTSKLSESQKKQLDTIFAAFDVHNNGRFVLSDIMRVADDFGIEYTFEEVQHMLQFWDSSGTRTISRDGLARIAIESKFYKTN